MTEEEQAAVDEMAELFKIAMRNWMQALTILTEVCKLDHEVANEAYKRAVSTSDVFMDSVH